ncbi:hypothetical protein PR003_g24423 [Phytophthora rubi]|uniref:RNase H type-1 domain-containing protein n=1 Tax=Phytophthora rubi TaxID=129364 RepID=A0A6A4CWY7_9STRA|nr:hypothetical protein PR003_g24423 [Phytophthora rubi]
MADGTPQHAQLSNVKPAPQSSATPSPRRQAPGTDPAISVSVSALSGTTPPGTGTTREDRPAARPASPVGLVPVTWRDLASVVSGPRTPLASLAASDTAHDHGGNAVITTVAAAATDMATPHPVCDNLSTVGDPHPTDATAIDVDAVGPADMTHTTATVDPIQGSCRGRRHRQHDDTTHPGTKTRAEEHDSAKWLLRFDGACRGNPGPGGAGAALFDPSGKIVWTCAQYLPGYRTNNFAEYAGLLAGVSSAVHHGITHLRVEVDSTLVIEQVLGRWQCRGHSLLRMRRQVHAQLGQLAHYTLTHIDRVANHVADNLANAALNRKGTRTECGTHPRSDTPGCWTSGSAAARFTTNSEEATPVVRRSEATMSPDEQADIACRDGGEVFPVFDLDSGAVPQRRPILRLRQLTTAEMEKAEAAVEAVASTLAVKISDTDDWTIGEGYLTAMSARLYEALLPYSDAAVDRDTNGSTSGRRSQRPPRTQASSSQRRLDEALRRLEEQQRGAPDDRAAIKRARRKIGRIRTAIRRQEMRGHFRLREKACVEEILSSAEPPPPAPMPLGRQRRARQLRPRRPRARHNARSRERA